MSTAAGKIIPNPFHHSRGRVAGHESGHAIVARCLGYDVRQVKIREVGKSDTWTGFVVTAEPCEPTEAETLLRKAQMLLGGCLAEVVHLGIYPDSAHHEIKKAAAIVRDAADMLGEDYVSLWLELVAETWLILAINDESLFRVSMHLLCHKTLSGKRLQALLREVNSLDEVRPMSERHRTGGVTEEHGNANTGRNRRRGAGDLPKSPVRQA
jgi:hypothetical protein